MNNKNDECLYGDTCHTFKFRNPCPACQARRAMDHVIKEYNCRIISVSENQFNAKIVPCFEDLLQGNVGLVPCPTFPDSWTIDLDKDAVSDKDLPLIKVGAMFVYRFGYRINNGQKIKGWEIVF